MNMKLGFRNGRGKKKMLIPLKRAYCKKWPIVELSMGEFQDGPTRPMTILILRTGRYRHSIPGAQRTLHPKLKPADKIIGDP